MGIGQKLKETFSGGEAEHNKSTPGSFPTDSDKSYIPPSGTHVGHQGNYGDVDESRLSNQLEHTRLGEIGEHSRDHGGERDVDNRNVMDPSDRRHGSNVMSSTGAAGDLSSRTTGTGENEHHHNKLHKRDDPRRYEDTSRDVGATSTSGGLLSHDTPKRKELASAQQNYGQDNYGSSRHQQGIQDNLGSAQQDYGQDQYGSSRHQGGMRDDLSSVQQNYGQDQYGSSRHQGGILANDQHHRQEHEQGHGIYNTVMGHGSKEETGRHHASHHDNYAQHDIRGTGQGYGANTGVGTSDMAYRSEQPATGSSGNYQTSGVGQSHQHQAGHGGAGLGAGAAGIAASEAAHHHKQHQGQYGSDQSIGTAHSTYNPASSASSGHRSYDIQNPTQTSGIGGNAGSNTISSSHQYPAFGQDSAPATGGYSSGNVPGQGHESIRSEARQPGMATGLAGSSDPSHSGFQSGQFGPGHQGAKVMHPCQHCGKDNDISRYFHKEAVYRLA